LREEHKRRQDEKNFISISQARKNKLSIDWDMTSIVRPEKLGVTALNDFPLEELRKYIDWTPFFSTWELKGRYPEIFEKPEVGEEAKKLFDDANRLLDKVIKEKSIKANAVFGLFAANSVEDDIEVYSDESKKGLLTTLHTLRQQSAKSKGIANLALSDFIAPKESGRTDYIGAFAVTAGIGVDELVKDFEKEHDDYNSIMIKALADRLAEAFAEHLHELVRRKYWAYAPEESFANDDLIREKYAGIRPAPGYPAQPDHTEKKIIFELLEVEKNTSICLTESLAMYPAASVSGLYFANAESKYFGLGKIALDQVTDYQKRKGMSLKETERWLSPILNYDSSAREEDK
jgi:5-methyltetrahydrofolate--homocysteine methyltransferase